MLAFRCARGGVLACADQHALYEGELLVYEAGHGAVHWLALVVSLNQ